MDEKEAHVNARKRIGISLASFFHPLWYIPGIGSWWPKMWTRWSVKTAREAGYEFLQALPCRGSEVLMPGGSLPVKYLEPAWRGVNGEGHGSFWATAKARLRRDPVGPRLEDWMFFPKDWRCKSAWYDLSELMQIVPPMKIFHHMEDGKKPYLLEVSPGLWWTPEQVVSECTPDPEDAGIIPRPDGLVLDTWHLRRTPRDDEIAKAGSFNGWLENLSSGERIKATLCPGGMLGWWKESLPILLPHTKLIHIQPRRDDKGEELRKFIASEPTELGRMIVRARALGYEGDFVIEASLGAGATPGKIREMITGIHGAVLDLITAPLGQFED